MIFDLISDFHVENNVGLKQVLKDAWKPYYSIYYPWENNKQSDVLVIAGDISNRPGRTINVIKDASPYYKHVVFVDGNHDHYYTKEHKTTINENIKLYTNIGDKINNAVFLNGKNSFKIGHTLFIGANGWYDFSAAEGYSFTAQYNYWKEEINDFTFINFIEEPHILAAIDADNIRKQVIDAQDDDSIKEIIIVTHTVPTKKGLVNPGHEWYSGNGSYGNMFMHSVVMADKAQKIKVWCFGHTHSNFDFKEHHIRYICNPRGTKKEHGYSNNAPMFIPLLKVDTEEEVYY